MEDLEIEQAKLYLLTPGKFLNQFQENKLYLQMNKFKKLLILYVLGAEKRDLVNTKIFPDFVNQQL
jgi:hypothetical protein